MEKRIGLGIDFHPFKEGRRFILGGVEIDYPLGLLGHSDADCLIHAIVDAILGALGERDIGNYFPDTDNKYKDSDSIFFLKKVVEIMLQKGFKVENLDCTVICESPKISPYIKAMKERLSPVLQVEKERIGIKATTTEQMGFIGRKEGIACLSVVLLTKEGSYGN